MFTIKIAFARFLTLLSAAIAAAAFTVHAAEVNTRVANFRVRAKAERAEREARRAKTDAARIAFHALQDLESADLSDITRKAWE